MELNAPTRSRASIAATRHAARRMARRDAAAGVNAFADRLLYDGWLEDNRRDRMKLVMIRAIVEWARDSARAS